MIVSNKDIPFSGTMNKDDNALPTRIEGETHGNLGRKVTVSHYFCVRVQDTYYRPNGEIILDEGPSEALFENEAEAKRYYIEKLEGGENTWTADFQAPFWE